jgi:hypothetical protein
MPDLDLPQDARAAAEAAYRNWRIGDDGEGRLHAALVAAAPLIVAAERERIAAMLRRAADGRREYASSPGADDHSKAILQQSAEDYESAIRLIEDPRTILMLIPSWRWTDEESRSVCGEADHG